MTRLECCLVLACGVLASALPQDAVQGTVIAQNRLEENFANGFSDDFAQNLPTQEFMGSFQDVPESKQDDNGGFFSLQNFPSFASIGGFDSMPDVAKDAPSNTFVEEFQFPAVQIPDIPDNQQQFALPQFPQKGVANAGRAASRVRRTAGEPDVTGSTLIPHRRVHRVQTDGQVPHSRSPREFKVIHETLPFHFESFPTFPEFQSERLLPEAPEFQSERLPTESPTTFGERNFNERSFTPSRLISSTRIGTGGRREEIRTDNQRFIPTIHPLSPTPPHRFFSSPPPPPRSPGPRGSRFINSHGPGFRENHHPRDHSGIRDFPETFYGSGAGRDSINQPEFTFPSSRRPYHREHEYEHLDNSLLGSGNFEVLRGGTFYDLDDPNIRGHGYDHLLDDGYAYSHNAPPTNNYVDDFFSNFRDFSEFAVRRSDDGGSPDDNDGFFGPGFASENIHQLANATDLDNRGNATSISTSPKNKEEKSKSIESDVKTDSSKDPTESTQHHKHRQPKNIQEVMEDLESQPSENSISTLPVDEEDPMIAIF